MTRSELPEPRASGAWHRYLRVQYRLIRLLDPLATPFWRGYGLGNVVELHVVGRRTGRPRRILLGLLQRDGHWFLGHPNGDVAWTRNLEAAGTAELCLSWPKTIPIRATRLPAGELRDQAILATSQHVFPGNIVYRLARRHVRAVGTYFLIEIASPDEGPDDGSEGPANPAAVPGPERPAAVPGPPPAKRAPRERSADGGHDGAAHRLVGLVDSCSGALGRRLLTAGFPSGSGSEVA